ncbi:MAG TPA: hypothetical protein PK006_10070 [Saprospiraceae bacterium]|nr:hypothetical protein [Saprospiraceae bacterium]
MRYIVFITIYFVSVYTIYAQKQKGKLVTTEADSIQLIKLKSEFDSLLCLNSRLKLINNISDSIQIFRLKNDSMLGKLKILNIHVDSIQKNLKKIDTSYVYNSNRHLGKAIDSLVVHLILQENDFYRQLSVARPTDTFCLETIKFSYEFLPKLLSYYFNYGDEYSLNANKAKVQELFNLYCNCDKNYLKIVQKTFLNAETNNELWRTLNLLLSMDISKCD